MNDSTTLPQKLIRTAIYIRVSSDEQAKSGDSIRDQQEVCQRYIDTHSEMELQDMYLDDGISGQKLKRDEFSRLIENVIAGKIDMIIFTKLERWFRNLRHYLNTQATLEQHDVSWLAVDQPYFDTSTPMGRAFVAQSMTWAELEAQNGGLRVRDVFKSKVDHGEVITGKVPLGFRIVNKHLELSEYAPIVAQAFQVTWDTQSMGQGLRFLSDYGIVMTLNNFRQSILSNPKYIGRYRTNEHYCPRIVSDELFQNIQSMLLERKNVRTSQKYSYIFSGLLICDECGKHMSGCHINVLTHKKSGLNFRYRYPAYECKRYRVGRLCENGGEIREKKIEDYLLSCIRDEIGTYLADYRSKATPVVDNRSKKQGIEKKLNKLKTLFVNDLITLDEYKADHDLYISQLNAIPDIVIPNNNITYLEKFLDTDFESIYDTFSNEEKRYFWRSILKEIRISKSVNRTREYHLIFL